MLRILGAIVFAAGVLLFLGNVTGIFPTFTGAGWIGLALGGILFRLGSKEQPS